MSMTGGISFFDKNKALFADGATCVASSNTADDDLILGTNKYFRWTSSGSNDATPETLTITLPSSMSISRIFLIDHNFKNYTIKYGSSPTNFTGVTGLSSYSDSKIERTTYAKDTSYYQFTPVTTNIIKITANTTQTANAQKYLNQLVVTNELGTLTGYPNMNGISLDRNIRKTESINGRSHIVKGYESAGFDLSLRTYNVQADIDLLDDLHDRENPFLAWLCGGIDTQFRFETRGFRLKDLYQMNVDAGLKNAYDRNVYSLGVNQQYSFQEVV